MKKLTTIALLVLLSSSLLYGHDTLKTYLDREHKECRKEFAVYYRTVYPDSSGMWIVNKFHMNGQLRMCGKYSDKKLKKQQGVVTSYYFNGQISETGQYLDNKKVGLWKNFYTNGAIASIGKRTNNQKDSIWSYYNRDSKNLFGNINYINGKAEGESKWYYESGKICEIMTYEKDKKISKVDYDEAGNIILNSEKDGCAEFFGGNDNMTLVIKQNMKYPEELRLQAKEGIVILHFIVRKDGKIDNLEIQKSDETLFDQEALRVSSLIKCMKPSRSHGQFIEQECTLPITFSLNNNSTLYNSGGAKQIPNSKIIKF